MDQQKIGRYIAECRKQKNLTQEQLAEKIGVTSKSVSRWENGKTMPDVSLFEPLCKELDISFNSFLCGENTDKGTCNITEEELEEYKELLKNQEKGKIERLLNSVFKSKSGTLEAKYNSSISNLLLLVIFSIVNIGLLLFNSGSYFLFSAFVPYLAVDYGMFLCGLYPEEFYYDVPDIVFLDKSFFYLMLAVAAAILLVYLLCWYLAKQKRKGALIFSFVFFIIDTAAMLLMTGISLETIVDVLFHIWVIAYLVIGLSTLKKMKKAPEETVNVSVEEMPTETDSTALRVAEKNVKCRVFLETDFYGMHNDMHIVYRRVKHTNELVVNGLVYDEYEALVEQAHCLTANVDGHRICAEFDGIINSKLTVDSQEIAKKKRLY